MGLKVLNVETTPFPDADPIAPPVPPAPTVTVYAVLITKGIVPVK
jgi:hypothetical protein